MAFTVTGADLITQVSVGDGDIYVLQQAGSIITNTTAMNLQGSADMRIEGDIFAQGAAMNDSGSIAGGEIFISVGPNSTIWSTNDTISISNHPALFELMNQGTIQSMDTGVYIRAEKITVANTGYIGTHGDSWTAALWLRGSDTATSDIYATNSGTLAALETPNASGLATVYFDDADQVRFSNSGEVLSDGNALRITDTINAVVSNSGLMDGRVYAYTTVDAFTFTNSGELGSNREGASLLLYADVNTVNNSGTVSGWVECYTGAVNSIVNSGYFGADINFGNLEDTYRGIGTGVVAGTVYGMGGNDSLTGGTIDDRLDGGDGLDTLRGGDGDDVLVGGIDFDRLFGGNGDDTVEGGDGDDYVFGGNDDDLVDGGVGNDRASGNAGADLIYGRAGDDTIYGGLGDDTIIGGANRDIMFGGDGIDIFEFQLATESAAGVSTRDTIMDFVQGEDLIDLTAVVPGVMAFIGSDAFSGTANEVRVVNVTASNFTRVFVDIDADGVEDMEIIVRGVLDMTAGDFDL